MARTRLVKPGFFKNEELAHCTPLTRLLFIGLWQQADREGRLEYRPMRLKAEILPYDIMETVIGPDGKASQRPVNVEVMLNELANVGLITLYRGEFAHRWQWIQIDSFTRHQNPHKAEPATELPPPNEAGFITSIDDIFLSENSHLQESRVKDGTDPALTLNPLTVTSPSERDGASTRKPAAQTDERFDEFWEAYPKKVGKKACRRTWRSRRLDSKADMIIRDVKTRTERDRKWVEGFAPNPQTYLNGDRWEDEMEEIKQPRAATSGFEEKDYGKIRGG